MSSPVTSSPTAMPIPAASPTAAAGRRQGDERFATLRPAARTWAVAAVHGEAGKLVQLHAALAQRLTPEDNLIYLGNLLGRGPEVAHTIDEVLLFRRKMLSRRGADPQAMVYLRGGQEEMWQKLLQLQFATDPRDVLTWMLAQGVGTTLEAYGSHRDAGLSATRQGALALSHWTSALRDQLRARDGHNALFGALRRAAFDADRKILFVNAGLDPARPLFDLVLRSEDFVVRHRTAMLWIGTGAGTFPAPHEAPLPEPGGGLEFVVLPSGRRRNALRLFRSLWARRRGEGPETVGLEVLRSSEVEIDSHHHIQLTLDGEAVTLTAPVRVSLQENGLRVALLSAPV